MAKKYKLLYYITISIVTVSLFYLFLWMMFQPSHDRNWELGHEALPNIIYNSDGNNITINNFRNFRWLSENAAEAVYETREFDLDKITSVDVLISHFDNFEGLAHIFLSFGFVDGEQVVVSLETRRESNETFSPLLGILRQYEIIYVVGSEADIVGVRTGHRNERIYLYPTKASPEQAQQLFRLLAEDINEVYKKPRMYNTLTNNCTNALTRRVEDMSQINFPITWKTIMPGYFDEVLYELELIDTSDSFINVKQKHLIKNDMVDETSKTYSQDLRSTIIN